MLHDGHRDRVLRRFNATGFSGMEEHQKLELILFFSVPRQDTNEIAHRLLNRYHTIARVLDAPADELKTFPLVTDRTVQLFKMIKETGRLYEQEMTEARSFLRDADEIAVYLLQQYAGIREERLGLISLDHKGKLLSFDFVGEGDVDSVGVSTRKVAETVLHTRATVAVLCHNHPGGIALPSRADVLITEQIASLFGSLGIHLSDHLIIAGADYYSMAASDEHRGLFTTE